MNQPSVTWRQVKKYFTSRDYVIKNSGGDAIITAPQDGKNNERTRNTVRIGHKCCNKPGCEVWSSYLNSIERAFNVTRYQILND